MRSDPDIEDNTIIEEVQAGYLQNSILLRPSKVIIIK
ncbi:MAG: nucleotide exchange factor GrpE [Candidatus Hodarchaeales archaeon]